MKITSAAASVVVVFSLNVDGVTCHFVEFCLGETNAINVIEKVKRKLFKVIKFHIIFALENLLQSS